MNSEHTIQSEFFVYKTPSCAWCDRVIHLLADHGYNPILIDITKNNDAKTFIVETHGCKTVPQVFHNNTRIGGYEDTKVYIESMNLLTDLYSS